MKTVKTLQRIIAFAAFLTCCSATLTIAEVPRIIAFQGMARNVAGAPLNGSFNLTFRLYDVLTGGVPLWTETHTNVPVSRGIFAVPLGAFTPLSPPFDRQYWLSIAVGTNPEMTPREPLTSAPYALRASETDNLSSNILVTITNIAISEMNSISSNILASVTNVVDNQSSSILAIVTNIVSNAGLPRGVIVTWSGSIASIPTNGWALCDGSNGTPDLRDKFVVGARTDTGGVATSNLDGSPKQSGGSTGQPPSTSTAGATEAHSSGPNTSAGAHSHTFVPPFYALAFIMKL